MDELRGRPRHDADRRRRALRRGRVDRQAENRMARGEAGKGSPHVARLHPDRGPGHVECPGDPARRAVRRRHAGSARPAGRRAVRELARADELAHALALDRADARATVVARELAHHLAHHLARARTAATRRVTAPGKWRSGRIAPLTGHLLAAAARLLPVGDRARYGEEFRSELAEIARAGAGRRPQLAYAVRQVMSVRRLRGPAGPRSGAGRHRDRRSGEHAQARGPDGSRSAPGGAAG